MNRINPKKLMHSKWTATQPLKRQKHFMVTEVEYDEEGQVTQCTLEAVISNHSQQINWQQLKNRDQWQQGWK